MTRFSRRADIEIDIEHTLQQLLSRFQSVTHGLPELVKNSKDQYSRLGLRQRDQRQIVVLVDTHRRRIGVLDFAGATIDDFQRWRKWSDPTANQRGLADDIEGGNGNGGKGFMSFGSKQWATFESVRNGRYTKMGFDTSGSDRLKPAFALGADATELKNLRLQNESEILGNALRELNASFSNLPNEAQIAFGERNAFTLISLAGVRDWSSTRGTAEQVRRRVSAIARELAEHPQAAYTLESCKVWLIVDGRLVDSMPIGITTPEPMDGFANLEPVPIPRVLTDPLDGGEVETGDGEKYLQLATAKDSLRMANNRPLNVIRVWNGRNFAANWSVADLFSRAESAHIYGKIAVPALDNSDHLSGADRESLADTPLVRALRAWTGHQIEDLANRIQRETARDHTREDRRAADSKLQELREAMREFLQEKDFGDFGSRAGASGEGQSGDESQPPTPRAGNRVDQLILEDESIAIAIPTGTSIPLKIRAYELVDGEQLPVQLSWSDLEFSCDSESIIQYLEEGELTGIRSGHSDAWFRHGPTGIESNRIRVDVLDCTTAVIVNRPDRLLLQGERVPLRVAFETADGTKRSDLLVNGSVDEENMGRVTRQGIYIAPGAEGQATVRVRFGRGGIDSVTAQFAIGTDRVQRPPKSLHGGDSGGDIPLILLCGSTVPGYEDMPREQRTFAPSPYEPTIIDFDPTFDNVIFINPDSHEAMQVRSGRGGRRGMAGIGTKTFGEFLATKCFEILKRLYVFQQAGEGALTPTAIRELFATAEQECAAFVPRAYEIGRAMAEEFRGGD